jgi:hypothetical protein
MLAMFVLYLLFLQAGACSETADAATVSGPSFALSMASVQDIAAFTPSLSDVQSRVLPTLVDAPSAARLNTELNQLVLALNLRDASGVEQQIELARATVAGYPAAARSVDAAELSVVEIALDRAAELVGMPALANRSTR